MAKYTIELRRVCELYKRETVENWFKDYELTDFLTPLQIQTIQAQGIWTKEKLAKKIVDHYFMREIGLETPALFAHYAKVKMNEIMESKLPLIYSAAIEYDPLVNVDFTETFERNIDSNGSSSSSLENESSGSSNSSSNQSASGLTINNETPQTNITKQNLDSGIYASSVNQNDSSSNIQDETTNSSESSSTTNSQDERSTDESYTKRIKGNSGVSATAQKMIVQYRENIIAIDKEIIEELNSLFMGLY